MATVMYGTAVRFRSTSGKFLVLEKVNNTSSSTTSSTGTQAAAAADALVSRADGGTSDSSLFYVVNASFRDSTGPVKQVTPQTTTVLFP
jgi:hypothetical protein